MSIAVLLVFAGAVAAPYACRVTRGATGWVLALLPAALFGYFASHIGPIADGETFTVSHRWVPSLDVTLSFHLDGLSLLFSLLITGIGALVLIYSGGYLAGHPHLGRFYAYLLMFMASMLGLVLADNVVALFVFWELTSLASYLLIGFDHERESARRGALQALLVTGVGGVALLAGLLLLAQAGGSMEISALLDQGESVRDHRLYLPVLLLVLAGAFTKSAQTPFHFWLPSAMEAPTPVSAYLHSATMVKAGVYLLARLHPVLSGTNEWLYIVTVTGAVTMIAGAYMALQHNDFKLILAYSTVSTLGALTMLIGQEGALAVKAAMVFLLAHALYKGALFLVAGAVDHETGVRRADLLGGLAQKMPLTAAAALLAAASMASLPPLFGFVAKETLLEAAREGEPATVLLTLLIVTTSALLVAVAGIVALRPFLGERVETPREPHEAPPSLWLGPLVLATLGLALGAAPFLVGESVVAPAVESVLRRPAVVDLSIWAGFNFTLALSVLSLAGGIAIYAGRGAVLRPAERIASAFRWGPTRWYDASLDGLNVLARWQTGVLQNGYLRLYLGTIILTTVVLVGYTLADRGGLRGPTNLSDSRLYEVAAGALTLLAAVVAVLTSSRLTAVVALGVVGYGVALVYLLFGAPDLAIAQVLAETLIVVLLVLVFYRLPRLAIFSKPLDRARDAVLALAAGGLITALLLTINGVQFHPSVSEFYSDNSLSEAHGRNVVNVILVDFRALDTLGEITVLVLAGIGVFALLKLRAGKGGKG